MDLLQNGSFIFWFEKSMNSASFPSALPQTHTMCPSGPLPQSGRFSSGALCHHLLGQNPLIFSCKQIDDSDTNMHICIVAWRTTTRNEAREKTFLLHRFVSQSLRTDRRLWSSDVVSLRMSVQSSACANVHNCNEMIWNMTGTGSQLTKMRRDTDGVNEYQTMLCIETSANSCEKELIRMSLFFRKFLQMLHVQKTDETSYTSDERENKRLLKEQSSVWSYHLPRVNSDTDVLDVCEDVYHLNKMEVKWQELTDKLRLRSAEQ